MRWKQMDLPQFPQCVFWLWYLWSCLALWSTLFKFWQDTLKMDCGIDSDGVRILTHASCFTDKTVWLTSLPTLLWSRGRPRRQQADEGVQGKAVASNAFPFPLFWKAGNLALWPFSCSPGGKGVWSWPLHPQLVFSSKRNPLFETLYANQTTSLESDYIRVSRLHLCTATARLQTQATQAKGSGSWKKAKYTHTKHTDVGNKGV